MHSTADLCNWFYEQEEWGAAQWEHPGEEAHEQQVMLQTEIGRLDLIAQYYGSMKLAIDRSHTKPAKIFLMPLGGGVFFFLLSVISRTFFPCF